MDLNKEMWFDVYLFTTDKQRIDVAYVHDYLSNRSYWASGIPVTVVKRSIENSLCFSIMHRNQQVGFARVITDFATFGYLADVFVDEQHRGRGLSKKLIDFIFTLDELTGLRRMLLGTRDAHGLYSKFGFRPLAVPDRFMELHNPDVYKRP